MIFLNPLEALISKNPFSFFFFFFFAEFGSGSPPGLGGVSLGRIFAVPSIEAFFWGGVSGRRAVSPPAPRSGKPAFPREGRTILMSCMLVLQWQSFCQ